MALSRRLPGGVEPTSQSRAQIIQRWRDLREMLIQQLDMFESGGLTLRSNNADVSSSAIKDLKKNILEFDAMISEEAEPSARD
jgi:hypothetical protein